MSYLNRDPLLGGEDEEVRAYLSLDSVELEYQNLVLLHSLHLTFPLFPCKYEWAESYVTVTDARLGASPTSPQIAVALHQIFQAPYKKRASLDRVENFVCGIDTTNVKVKIREGVPYQIAVGFIFATPFWTTELRDMLIMGSPASLSTQWGTPPSTPPPYEDVMYFLIHSLKRGAKKWATSVQY